MNTQQTLYCQGEPARVVSTRSRGKPFRWLCSRCGRELGWYVSTLVAEDMDA